MKHHHEANHHHHQTHNIANADGKHNPVGNLHHAIKQAMDTVGSTAHHVYDSIMHRHQHLEPKSVTVWSTHTNDPPNTNLITIPGARLDNNAMMIAVRRSQIKSGEDALGTIYLGIKPIGNGRCDIGTMFVADDGGLPGGNKGVDRMDVTPAVARYFGGTAQMLGMDSYYRKEHNKHGKLVEVKHWHVTKIDEAKASNHEKVEWDVSGLDGKQGIQAVPIGRFPISSHDPIANARIVARASELMDKINYEHAHLNVLNELIHEKLRPELYGEVPLVDALKVMAKADSHSATSLAYNTNGQSFAINKISQRTNP